MIANKLKYIAFLSLIILFSCEKDIEIEVKEGTDQMVLNAWFEVGEVPEIKINHSLFIFEGEKNTRINDADVSLYSNGELLAVLEYDAENETYKHTDFIILENTNYEIVAEHAKYGTVKSTIQSPQRLKKEDIELKYVNFISDESQYQNYSGEIQIKLNDQADQKNYYLIRLLSVEESYNADESEDTIYRYNYWNSLETNDSQIESVFRYANGEFMFLRDELFDGREYTVKLSSYSDLRQDEQVYDSTYYVKRYHQIQLYQVNEAIYRYYISIEDNEYPDVFTEPSQVYSNIENGYGLIGVSVKHIKTIEESRNEN